MVHKLWEEDDCLGGRKELVQVKRRLEVWKERRVEGKGEGLAGCGFDSLLLEDSLRIFTPSVPINR